MSYQTISACLQICSGKSEGVLLRCCHRRNCPSSYLLALWACNRRLDSVVCPLSDGCVSSHIMAHQQAPGLPSWIRAHSAPFPLHSLCARQARIILQTLLHPVVCMLRIFICVQPKPRRAPEPPIVLMLHENWALVKAAHLSMNSSLQGCPFQ